MGIVVITGCAIGIGREIAIKFAKEGYDIVGTYNTSVNKIDDLKKTIELMKVKFDGYKIDLTKEDEINGFYKYIRDKYGGINILVNNAAKSLDNEFSLKTKAEFMEVLEVNLVAPFLLIQKLSNIMTNGVIINIASTDGINTYTKLNMDYSASKAGLINLTKSLALELSNIKVYAICPNWVNTESIREMEPGYLKSEMKRVGQEKLIEPSDVATKVYELTSGSKVSGSIIVMED